MPKIKITGKGGEGGTGGGKGESKFERLWKAVLRDPNPSTIRTFKELFDVADPSQTLFPGGNSATTGAKINASQQSQIHRELLRSVQAVERRSRMAPHTTAAARSISASFGRMQNLKSVAAHAGIPLEDTFTRMEKSAREKYSGYMRAHQNYTRSSKSQAESKIIFEKQEAERKAIIARQAFVRQRIAKDQEEKEKINHSHAIALKMDKARTERQNVLKQKSEAAKQSQNIRMNKDHAAAIGMDQARESRLFGATPAGVASRYRNGMITSAIGGAEGAVALGSLSDFRKHYQSMNKMERSAEKQVKLLTGIKSDDDKELRLAQQHLSYVKSAKGRAGRIGTARFGNAATRKGLGSLMEAGGLADMLGPEAGIALGVAGAAVGATKLAYSGPSMLNSMANSLISGQKPYMDYMLSSSRLAGQFGLSGKDLRTAIFTPGGKISGWMKRQGITPTEALKFLAAGGGGSPIGTPNGYNHIKGTIEAMRAAQLNPYLRGLSTEELGSLRTTGTLAGVTTGLSQNLSKYYEKLAESVEKGTEKGVNRATILHGLTASIHTLAANNSVLSKGSMGGIDYLYNKMMLGGMPGARLGSLQQSVFSELSRTTSHLTNSPARMTYALQYMMHLNHGNLPINKAGFENIAGKSVYNHILKSPAQKYLMESGLRAFKSGNDYLGLYELQKVLGPFWSKRLGTYVANEVVEPGYGARLPVEASISGTQLQKAASAFYKTPPNMSAKTKYNIDHMVNGSEKIRASQLLRYMYSSAKTNHINGMYLAGVAGAESGMGANTVNGATHGVFQVTPGTWKQFAGGLPYADANNPKYDALVAGRYISFLQKNYHLKGKRLFWAYTYGQNSQYMHNPEKAKSFMKDYYPNAVIGEASISKVSNARLESYKLKVKSSVAALDASKQKMNESIQAAAFFQNASIMSSGMEKGAQSAIDLSNNLNDTVSSLNSFHKSLKKITKAMQETSPTQARTGLSVH